MPDIQMNFESIDHVALQFKDGSHFFSEAAKALDKAAQIVSEGALHGEVGDKMLDNLKGFAVLLYSGSDVLTRIGNELLQAKEELHSRDQKIRFQ